MTQPFIGQIQPYGFNFAPKNWALCNGQILSISQNTALFSLLGTYYGGNGTTNFALPDLRSRVPVHQGTLTGGSQYFLGEQDGVESVTLTLLQTPAHTHVFSGTSANANAVAPSDGTALAETWHPGGGGSPGDPYYAPDTTPQALNPGSMSPWGSGAPQAHTNLQPYLTINWCICMAGIYPSRN
jgi:microcystin-dependent protein